MARKLSLGARVLQKAADSLDFPADMVAGAPRITIIGNGEVQLYNHTGLRGYADNELHFDTRRGLVCVTGEGLRLRTMSCCEATIIGRIDAVAFVGEDGDND